MLAALMAGMLPAEARGQEIPPYKDPTLPFEQRVADLLSRMAFEEKAEQLQVMIPANPRLGIPACRWGTEAMHGVPGGTMFPDSMALAATWNPDLIHKVATAIGDEARGRANPGGANGLILWCPNLNLARDPRSGRNMETYGEDPYLSGRLGVAYVKGLQGNDPKYLKTIATPKHFAVYSQESGRASSNAFVNQRSLQEYYLKPFGMAVMEGGAQGIMSAYNAINSVPCSGNEWLLTTVLRDQWHFTGAVVSDSSAVAQMTSAHRFTDSDEKAAAVAISAGLDVVLGSVGNPPAGAAGTPNPTPASRVTAAIVRARDSGLLTEDAVNRAAGRSLLARFKLGLFDPPSANPYAALNASSVGTPQHIALALQSGREAITLLQNDVAPRGYGFEKLLPLDLRRIESIAIIGPYAAMNLYGSYAGGGGTVSGTRGPAPLEAIRQQLGDRIVIRNAIAADTEASLEAARLSDVVLFIGGFDNRMDKAGSDRATMDLPYDQTSLLDKIVKVNPLTVAILNGGSVIGLESLKAKIPAIMMMWYDGEQGGNALAEVLLGITNPAGRLPVTFHKSLNDVPPIDDYDLAHGRTYMYCQKPAAFPFGHGLSYTTFAYDDLKVLPPASAGAPVTLSIAITNTGPRDGDEVVQIYARKTESGIPRPIRQLVAFQRISLNRGEKKTIAFSVPQQELAYWDTSTQKFVVEPGAYEWMAGASCEDIRQKASLELK
jgi:beta-glucosidase